MTSPSFSDNIAYTGHRQPEPFQLRRYLGIQGRPGFVNVLGHWNCNIFFFSVRLSSPENRFFLQHSGPDRSGNLRTSLTCSSLTILFIPSAEGFLPAIVIFCFLCLGLALLGDEENKPLMNLLSIIQAAPFPSSPALLPRTLPIGVFVITAQTMGTIGFEGLLELQVFLISLALLAALGDLWHLAPVGLLFYYLPLQGNHLRIIQGDRRPFGF